MNTQYEAILIVSFGGPEGMEDVMPFLDNVLKGRNIPAERKQEVAHHYGQFGGKSPINDQNRRLIKALRVELTEYGIHLPIYWGNRNWHPLLTDSIQEMANNHIKHALAFFTSAYSSYSGCRQYRENIVEACDAVGKNAPRIDKIRVYYNHPGFIGANCERIREALAKIPEERLSTSDLIFTAHSLPCSMAACCSYEQQLLEASEIIAAELSISDWKLVYQSRSGPPSQPWLEPDVCTYLNELKRRNTTDVVLAPIGFVSDHMEILFDLDTEARELCRELGINMELAKTVGTHPQFIAMIRELIQERLFGNQKRRALGKYGPEPDICAPKCCIPQRSPIQALS